MYTVLAVVTFSLRSSHCNSVSPLRSSILQDLPSGLCCHTRSETVCSTPTLITWLICTFHLRYTSVSKTGIGDTRGLGEKGQLLRSWNMTSDLGWLYWDRSGDSDWKTTEAQNHGYFTRNPSRTSFYEGGPNWPYKYSQSLAR